MQAENLHKFTVEEYLALYEKGVFENSVRTQLLNGDILQLSPIGFRHSETQNLIFEFFRGYLDSSKYQIRLNGSIVSDDGFTLLEPDLYIIKAGTEVIDNYLNMNQIEMAVEVADSTLAMDLINDGHTGKLANYAKGRVNKVWVVDIKGIKIHEFLYPDQNALYQQQNIRQGRINIAEFTDASALVADLIYV